MDLASIDARMFSSSYTHISPHHEVVDKIDDPSHRAIRSTRSLLRAREIDWFPIFQETPCEKEVINISRRGLETLGLHCCGKYVSSLSARELVVAAQLDPGRSASLTKRGRK